jgi:hypothetical protein
MWFSSGGGGLRRGNLPDATVFLMTGLSTFHA